MQDTGAALVEFVLVSILVVIIALGLIQLALALHVRNMLASAASEGARVAAAYDSTLADGHARTRDVLSTSIGGYPAQIRVEATSLSGADLVEVRVWGPTPVFGLWGFGTIEVHAHAYVEVHRG